MLTWQGAAVIELLPFMCHRMRAAYTPIADALFLHYSFWQPTDDLVPDMSWKVSSSTVTGTCALRPRRIPSR
jgi:hypothetical protein